MKAILGSRKRRDAQTLVFFLLAWGTIMLLCGLAIDSGLLYLAKARLSRAVDGAALVAVGNFNRSTNPVTNRDDVALIMRNFAVANYTDLGSISTTGGPSGGTASTTTGTNGQPVTTYMYSFNDGTEDANSQYRRYVQVILTTGSGGAITGATCNARCPVQTYFIGYATYAINGRQNVKIGGYSGPSGLVDLKVSSQAVATRNPRLIMVVIDRSASMLQPNGGASGLPPAIVQFLDFFDTSSDNIGIVSFGSSARLEMPLTTNFIIAGTNNLTDAYETNDAGAAEPGIDPESEPTQSRFDPNYATTGIRRLKFGGDTAADDGIRLGLEQMMANSGFNDPDVVKYMVIFTDGKWNASRTLLAAPGYTNEVDCPTFTGSATNLNVFVSNAAASLLTSNGAPGAWVTDVTNDTGLLPVPTLSPMPYVTNAIVAEGAGDYATLAVNHLNDVWLSADGTNEPLGTVSPLEGGLGTIQGTTTTSSQLVVTNTWVGQSASGGTNYYTHNLDVWLQPGSVDYVYNNGAVSNNGTYVSCYTNTTQHINVYLNSGDSNVLVVPGYIADGVVYDGLDLNYYDNPSYGVSGYPRYRVDNYQQQYMWCDDAGGTDTNNGSWVTVSLQRQLMFRNYPNLLTGFYIFRPDDPLATYTPSNPVSHGVEPLVTEDNPPGAPRPLYGLGAYYPSAGFYWPFGGETDTNGYVTNAVGVDWDPTYALLNPVSGESDQARHIAYSINMLSSNAAPEWYGELFYDSISGGGTNTVSGVGTASASQIMQSADWQNGAPSWMTAMANGSGIMTNEPTHDTNIVGSPSVWRPFTFNGSNSPVSFGSISPHDSANLTGGYVTDGAGHYYRNTMAWSGRPTHYFDFSQSKWIKIANNHLTNQQFLQMGTWKAQEYAWHARALGITIYTVGYGDLVSPAQQALLAVIANSTNTTAGNPQTFDGTYVTSYTPGAGTAITYNPSQPIGQQFYATNAADISNDFYSVGQAINAALTQ
ncbi:MAG: pilus assembly protein TadG-related protein [Methylacidiphilales bacterium]|nr:pilus assembly protein TadG-related protein [Candidatus Methylacidiphilales bacterium]